MRPTTLTGSDGLNSDHEWDAGALGCDERVIGLRVKLKAMRPGQITRVRATD